MTVIELNLSTYLWFGTDGGVSRYDGQQFTTFTTQEGLAHNVVMSISGTADGVIWFGHRRSGSSGVSRYDGRKFVNFTTKNGLLADQVRSIYHDSDGRVWFATRRGVSRYDGKGFVNFTIANGLVSEAVEAIYQAPDGTLWFGTNFGGVSRYEERQFVNFTTEDGLKSHSVGTIYGDSDGVIWLAETRIGAERVGVHRYDGNDFMNFTEKDGLVSDYVPSIYQGADGVMWFGTHGGVSRYDGKRFVNFTVADGLLHNTVKAIHRDADGVMWFGTHGGVSRYDGKTFQNFTTADGLGENGVWTIHQEPNGDLWFCTLTEGISVYDGKAFKNFTIAPPPNTVTSIYGNLENGMWLATNGSGVFQYDGSKFVNFTTADGLSHNYVFAVHRDADGIMWFATHGGGAAAYDGTAWTSLHSQDGVAGDAVMSIYQDDDGDFWFGTLNGGLTRYRRNRTKPRVQIVSVTTDETYRDLDAIPAFPTGTRAIFKYRAIDFKTVPEKRQYRLRIVDEKDDALVGRRVTKDPTFDYLFKKAGTFSVEVVAIDRDLNYSAPARVTLTVVLPWYLNGWIMFPSGGILLAMLSIAFYFGKRLQTQRAIAQQFNPYIAGRVVGADLFYGRSDLITDIERTLANNCFLLYGERRIGKTSLQHQLRERLGNADDPTYKFIPAYIDLQGVAEDDFFHTIGTGVVEACHSAALLPLPPNPPTLGGKAGGDTEEGLSLRIDEERESYTYRDLNRDLRTILNHLKEGEDKTVKLVLLMDEVDTLNRYELRTNLNLRGLFMGPHKENLVLVMSGLYLKMDWSEEGGGSPPFNFLSREIQIQPLEEAPARQLITEPAKGFYTYEPKAVDLILSYSELKPFTIQGICLRAVNRVLADGRTKITADDIEAIKDAALVELQSIRGERAGTALPASLNEALSLIGDLKAEIEQLRGEAA